MHAIGIDLRPPKSPRMKGPCPRNPPIPMQVISEGLCILIALENSALQFKTVILLGVDELYLGCKVGCSC